MEFLSPVRNGRKLLNPRVKNARSEGKMVKMVCIDGWRFFVNDSDALIEIR